MFADEIFALQKIHTAAVYMDANYFRWSRANVTHIMPNDFKNTKSFWFNENGVNLGWSDPIYKESQDFPTFIRSST